MDGEYDERGGVDGGGVSDTVVIHNVVATANFGCDLDLQRIAWRYHGEYNPSTFAAVQLRLPQPRTTALVFGSGKARRRRAEDSDVITREASARVLRVRARPARPPAAQVVCTGARNEWSALTAIAIYFYMARAHRVSGSARACPSGRRWTALFHGRRSAQQATTAPPRGTQVWRLHPDAKLVSQCIQNIVSSANLNSSVRIDEMSREIALSLIGHYEPDIFPGFRLGIKSPDMKALVFTGGKVVLTGGKTREDIARAWAILKVVVDKYLARNAPGRAALTHTDIVQLNLSNKNLRHV